jgi:hypothetical protein
MPSRPDPLRGALPGYAWDLRMGNGAGRYRHLLPDGRLGRLVSRDAIVDLLRTVSDASGERFAQLARSAVEGRISSAEFFRTTQAELRALYNSTSALAAGGWNRMTPQLHGANGRILGLGTREYPVGEYTSLRNFAQDIADGKLTPAQAGARARLYAGKAYSRFWQVETQRLADAGYTEERWLDTKLPNECSDCPELAARGWVPIGTLPDPGDGATECLGNCRCSKVQRNAAGVVAKANPYHEPPGSAVGGRFARKPGGNTFSETVRTGTEASNTKLGGGVTDTVLVSFVDDGAGIWKAVEQAGDAIEHNGNCEVAAHRLSQLLGMDNVPTTEFMAHAGVDGTVQQWVDDLTLGSDLSTTAIQEGKYHSMRASDFENVLVLDAIMNNPDRNPGNWALDAQGKLWAIDHGHASFRETSPLRVRNPKQPDDDMECARVEQNSMIDYVRRSHAKGDTNHYDQWIPSMRANGEIAKGTTRAWQVSSAQITRWRKIDKNEFMRAFTGISRRPVGDSDGADIEAAWRNFQNVLNTGRIAWW